MVEYGILGPLAVRRADGTEPGLSRGQRLLLAMFLVRPGHVVPGDLLAGELWPDASPEDPAAALRNQLSRLRRVLGPGAGELSASGAGYRLRLDPAHLDATRFADLLSRARAEAGEPALNLLEAALGLWRGAALGEFADRQFAAAEAVRLEEMRVTAAEDRAELLLALGRARDAAAALPALVAGQPYRERARALLMQALYRQGRQAEALETYRSWRRLLADDLGLDPSPAMARLERDILRHVLDPPAEPRPRAHPPEHNLPTALGPLIGRGPELAELGSLLNGCRVLTLTGIGGAGKTRLAVELARGAPARFPDGVFLAELGALADPAEVPRQVAAAVGLPPPGAAEPATLLGELCSHLRARRILLVLDNCEHLAGAAAGLAQALAVRCAGVTVLATSREPLGIPGETVRPVPPLALPAEGATAPEEVAAADAVALLCARAHAADPTFALDADNAADVARICRRLDGIPLALELAAGWLNVLTPHQVTLRLDDGFSLLTGNSRGVVPRHQTLLAAMDWSYRLLSPVEQAVLRRLAVFVDGFDVDAAEAVAADGGLVTGPDVLPAVRRLVSASLLSADQATTTTRLRLLETVRAYAGDRLTESREREQARLRHRDLFLTMARGRLDDLSFWWDTHGWISRLRADENNFRAALRYSRKRGEADACLALAAAMSYYDVLGGDAGVTADLEWSLETAPPGPARVRGLVCLATSVAAGGLPARAEALLREARTVAAGCADPVGAGFAAEVAGCLAYGRGELERAASLLHEARRLFTEGGCAPGMWGCEYDLGWLALAEDRPDRAVPHFERALEFGRGAGSDDLVAHTLAALAPVTALSGDAARAYALVDEALEVTRRLGLRLFVTMALVRRVEVGVALGRLDEGIGALSQALAMLRDIGGTAWLRDTLELAALAAAAAGHDREAARLFGASRGAAGSPVVRAVRSHVAQCRAEVERRLGRATFAEEVAAGRADSTAAALDRALRLVAAMAVASQRRQPES